MAKKRTSAWMAARRYAHVARELLRNPRLGPGYLALKASLCFDGDEYLERNPDVRRGNIDPALHYVTAGAKEGRSRPTAPETGIKGRIRSALGMSSGAVQSPPLADSIEVIQLTGAKPPNPYFYRIPEALRPLQVETRYISRPRDALSACSSRVLVHLHQLEGQYHRKERTESEAAADALLGAIGQMRERGARIVMTWHNPWPHDRRLNDLDRRVYVRLAQLADAIVVHARCGRSHIHELNPEAPVYFIRHPSLGACDIRVLSSEPRPRLGGTHFVVAGEIKPYKRVPLILEAFQGLDSPTARLTLAGRCSDPALTREIYGLSSAAGDRVSWLDRWLDPEELSSVLRSADFFVHAQDRMWASGSAIQAARVGVPVIVPSAGGYPEYFQHDVHGLHFEPGSVASLRSALAAATRLDASRRTRMRDANLDDARFYSLERIAPHYRKLFEHVLATRH